MPKDIIVSPRTFKERMTNIGHGLQSALSFLFKKAYGVDPYCGRLSMKDEQTGKRVEVFVSGGQMMIDNLPCSPGTECTVNGTIDNPAEQITETLTFTENPADATVVDIGAQTYTFNTVLGGANSILIGAAATNSLDNLIAAINGDAGSGTLYGVATPVNVDVTAAAGAGDTMDVTSILYIDSDTTIAVTTDVANATWSDDLTGQDWEVLVNAVALPNTYPISEAGDTSNVAQLKTDIEAELTTQGVAFNSVSVQANGITGYNWTIVGTTTDCTALNAVTIASATIS